MINLPAVKTRKGVSYREISGPNGLLANLMPFEGNSLSAERNPGYVYQGMLRHDECPSYGVVYVVRSYSTPIAWVFADGRVHCVEERFSVTTSKQQGYVRAWTGAAVEGTSTHAHHREQGYRSA